VYRPFFTCVLKNNRRLLENNLLLKNNRYEIDFDDLSEKASNKKTKLFLFCSPHNPTGRVWTKKELQKISEICIKNDVVIVSDEIHSDLTWRGFKHIPLCKISKKIQEKTIISSAPCKAFNIAGLNVAYLIAPNKDLRYALKKYITKLSIEGLNIFAGEALIAAYNNGERWLNAALKYIQENYYFLENYLAKYLPKLKVIKPEATYLVWLDFREFNLTPEELNELILYKAKLALNDGRMFSNTQGAGFQRINIACSRKLLKIALDKLIHALKKY